MDAAVNVFNFQACLEDCLLDDDCDDQSSETGSNEPTETASEDPDCYSKGQCITFSGDTGSADETYSESDETYSGPDCIATDCVGEPCEEGDSDTRSGSTFILTCVNGVWEGENVYHDEYSSESDSSDPSDGVTCVGSFCAGDPCANPGYIGELENEILVCEDGEWSAQSQPHGNLPWLGEGPPPWADENGCVDGYKWYCNDYSECYPCDYDSGDGSGDSSDDCEYGGSECLGQPCDMDKKSASPKGSTLFYNCVDGVWVEDWNFEGTWSSEHEPSVDCTYGGEECVGRPCNVNRKNPVFRDSGVVYNCVDGFWIQDWEYNGSGGSWSNGYDTGTVEPSETGSGPVLFEPCDNEGEIIPISQHYTANFESSGSDDSDARVKIIKGMDLQTEYINRRAFS